MLRILTEVDQKSTTLEEADSMASLIKNSLFESLGKYQIPKQVIFMQNDFCKTNTYLKRDTFSCPKSVLLREVSLH